MQNLPKHVLASILNGKVLERHVKLFFKLLAVSNGKFFTAHFGDVVKLIHAVALDLNMSRFKMSRINERLVSTANFFHIENVNIFDNCHSSQIISFRGGFEHCLGLWHSITYKDKQMSIQYNNKIK